MSKCRIIYKANKEVSVLHPAPKPELFKGTEEQWLKRCYDKMTKDNGLIGLPYDDTEEVFLPSKEDRDAWEGEKGKGIIVNETKAQAIRGERHRAKLIKEEKDRILYDQAVANLKKEGKIT